MPDIKFGDFTDILLSNGFVLDRQSGSHKQYVKTEGDRVWLVTVAGHKRSDSIKPATLASMIRQSGLDKKAFR